MSYDYLAEGIEKYLIEEEVKELFTTEAREVFLTTRGGKIYAKTSLDDGHTHWYALDQNGNGFTLSEFGYPYDGVDQDDMGPNEHRHEVKNWIVLQSEAHIHKFDLRKAAQEKLGHKVIEDPVTMDDVNPDNIVSDKLDDIEK